MTYIAPTAVLLIVYISIAAPLSRGVRQYDFLNNSKTMPVDRLTNKTFRTLVLQTAMCQRQCYAVLSTYQENNYTMDISTAKFLMDCITKCFYGFEDAISDLLNKLLSVFSNLTISDE
uniref:Uncharacterized protein n=1 Tax=Trichuris muris TaxID=70415 RepID=A0A5S6QTB8_TRIMR